VSHPHNRFNEILKVKTEGSKCFGYNEFHGELEHLKIETRLMGEIYIDEIFCGWSLTCCLLLTSCVLFW
jgi:hypothetical protein